MEIFLRNSGKRYTNKRRAFELFKVAHLNRAATESELKKKILWRGNFLPPYFEIEWHFKMIYEVIFHIEYNPMNIKKVSTFFFGNDLLPHRFFFCFIFGPFTKRGGLKFPIDRKHLIFRFEQWLSRGHQKLAGKWLLDGFTILNFYAGKKKLKNKERNIPQREIFYKSKKNK